MHTLLVKGVTEKLIVAKVIKDVDTTLMSDLIDYSLGLNKLIQ